MLRRRRFNVPAHDPIHGIDPANVVENLDTENWPHCAVCRTDGDDHYYIYINQPLRGDDTPDPERYFIIVSNLYRNNCNGRQWKTHFATLLDALNYVNGDDASDFSKYTFPSPTPPKSGPKPKSDIAKSVEAAAKALEKEMISEPPEIKEQKD